MRGILVALCLVSGHASAQLNVSIATFDPGIPQDNSLHQDLDVFPKIRRIESLFLPFVLRQAFEESGDWGAVRVVPTPDDAAEILITGRISHSDGESLSVTLRAVDARGQEWVTGTYTSTGDYDDLFDEFVRELQVRQASLDDQAQRRIVGLSLMRYAAALVPEAYGDYVEALPDGEYRLLRLPAETDPLMARVRRVRSVEYVMTDAIDQEYRKLHDEVDAVYEIWRDYRRWYTTFRSEEARRNELSTNEAAGGSYEAMRKAYDNYRLDRLATEEQDKWIVGFNNEMTPIIDSMEQRIVDMNGWVEQGYSDWTRILGELFEIEGSVD